MYISKVFVPLANTHKNDLSSTPNPYCFHNWDHRSLNSSCKWRAESTCKCSLLLTEDQNLQRKKKPDMYSFPKYDRKKECTRMGKHTCIGGILFSNQTVCCISWVFVLKQAGSRDADGCCKRYNMVYRYIVPLIKLRLILILTVYHMQIYADVNKRSLIFSLHLESIVKARVDKGW